MFYILPNIHLFSRKFEEAKKRIEKTIEWRREFKPDLIPPEEVSSRSNFFASWVERPRYRSGLKAKLGRCERFEYTHACACVADGGYIQHP